MTDVRDSRPPADSAPAPFPHPVPPDDDGHRALFDRIPVGVYRTTPDGRTIDANPALVQLSGFATREELLAVPLQELLVDPAERLRWQELMEKDGVVRDFEFRQRRPDGTVIIVRETARAIRDAAGDVVAYEGIVEDVTARHAAAEQLRLQAEMLAAVGEAVVCTDAAGTITYWSRSAQRLFGWSADEVLGRHVVEVAPALSFRPRARELLARVARGGSFAGEFTARRRDGGEVPILLHLTPLLDAAGCPVGTVGVCTDLSQQKREEATQRFLAEAGTVLASSLDYQTTLSTVARLAVPHLADWCFVDVVEDDATIRRVATAHVDPEMEELTRALMRYPPDLDGPGITARVIRTGKPWFEPDIPAEGLVQHSYHPEHLRILRRLGLRSGIAVPLTARGRTVGVLRFATTGERRFETHDLRTAEELARLAALAVDNARLYRQAQRALEAREQILRVVSHDLRNPLGAIQAHADMLLERARGAIPEREWATVIRGAAEHMNRMIRDLIDVANLEAGRLSMEPAPHAVPPLLAEAAAMLRPLASKKGVQLAVIGADEAPPVQADRERVLQVLSNLLGNAIKFSPAAGRVEVHAERAGGEVCFSVSDSGPGLATEEAERVFEPFWRGRRAPRDGLGLGLSIARRIVLAHEGRIWAEPRPGGGSVFRFTLPAGRDDGRAAAA